MNQAVSIMILLVPILIGLFTYKDLPEQMVIHFGPGGEPDGFQSKGTFFLTYILISIVIFAIVAYTRKIDPKKQNYEKFEKAYGIIRLLTVLILSAAFSHLLAYNLGMRAIGADVFANLIIGVLWLVIGNYLPQVRSNYFIGIKTPWTLASEEVWRKTHRMSGPLWVIAGLFAILSAFLPAMRDASWPLLVVIGLSVGVPVIYSYMAYRRLEGTKG
ncbi:MULTISPECIES: SdpI family protein [Brevibacillus]|jgi:uncharacterized membrane protein|uniref:DUF1648 domain-containing protein n=2 Tax=Brevibacillus borstelensis TaxID=45462 RepID=M8DI02_9BACL|nr:SdpI family protein [Brevibacillus borstelensis]EMT53168.1 hypothetical protein I532_10332 [Brevibacillus borstelensis AK1]KKX55444.1 hypothetical protein X546_07095 [Brevibacillus borstelensis cifa_chp40]MBE5397592.1 SdpI family protein [Brevibacillus borstelensis]MCC0563590.1 SdpI family protein [Brevibacillus borstelensis]MCM3469233.1 SdpI family protein [Brevibacillus borstelensis]